LIEKAVVAVPTCEEGDVAGTRDMIAARVEKILGFWL
jgi:hypothetical protein